MSKEVPENEKRVHRETGRARVAKSIKVKSPCKHQLLHFDAGGLYLVCSNKECGQAWQAVNKERLVPDFMARGWGFSDLDKRKDPYT